MAAEHHGVSFAAFPVFGAGNGGCADGRVVAEPNEIVLQDVGPILPSLCLCRRGPAGPGLESTLYGLASRARSTRQAAIRYIVHNFLLKQEKVAERKKPARSRRRK